MAEEDPQMTETQQQSSPPLLDEQLNDENEDKETVKIQAEEEIIQVEEEIIQSCEEEEEDPGKINAEEEREVEQFEDPIKLQVEINREIGQEQVVEIPELEENLKEEEEELKEETDIVNVEQQHLQQDEDDEMEGPPPGWDSLPPPPQLPPSPQPEMGQMVCGSCRHLLSYPQGSKHVRCSCCLTVNYVLEEHQVGQVKCEICAVLLMYPFGAQSVRCCSCCSVINIGDHNRRPSLSVQQSQACRPFSIGH
ncbi:uncharacterized protein LOC141642986 [Silene latifolia]|uniref:uncharacterized protein LOC141642986 n=1 Tax=Silene latifolia TaxID=37657 RepID=UPI003D775EE5